MTIPGVAIRKLVAGCMAMALAAPMSTVAAYAQQAAAAGNPIQNDAPAQAQNAPAQAQIDAPAPAQNSTPAQTPAPANAQDTANSNGQSSNGQGANGQNVNGQAGAAPAVGTAAAPAETNAGVAASRPAGAVIAPAKQRRVRAILIKVSILVGAGVAVGTVAALSHGSASQPR